MYCTCDMPAAVHDLDFVAVETRARKFSSRRLSLSGWIHRPCLQRKPEKCRVVSGCCGMLGLLGFSKDFTPLTLCKGLKPSASVVQDQRWMRRRSRSCAAASSATSPVT